MSEEVKATVETTEANTEKKMTKYDLKMQRRAEEKKKEERDAKISTAIGVVVVLLLLAFFASFPIRSYMAVNKTICTIDGKDVKKVEFDYYYNLIKNNYMNSYGSYLSYYGVNSEADLSTVSYSGDLTFKDYFEEQAVGQIKQVYAMNKEGKANGFTYDVEKKYKELQDTYAKNARENNQTVKEYLQGVYGIYATPARLKTPVEESIYSAAYYDKLAEDKAITDAEATAYYEENKDAYDCVDYYLTTINAELPTAPTELAEEGAVVAEDGSYTPSDAEVEAAMAIAKEQADSANPAEGTLTEGVTKSEANYYASDWLFEEGRAEGDSTVVENSASHVYYVVQFINRYRNDEPTADMRVIITEEDNGAKLVDEWKSGAATEDSFIEMVKKYSTQTTDDGMFKNQSRHDLNDDLKNWLFDEARKPGDVDSVFLDAYNYTYVMYYVGQNDPEWMATIKSTLLDEKMDEYVDNLVEAVSLSDPHNNLAYIKIHEAEEAAAAEAEAAEAENSEAETSESATTAE